MMNFAPVRRTPSGRKTHDLDDLDDTGDVLQRVRSK
jgi:hypothetical protein